MFAAGFHRFAIGRTDDGYVTAPPLRREIGLEQYTAIDTGQPKFDAAKGAGSSTTLRCIASINQRARKGIFYV